MALRLLKNPIARKRLARFKEMKRAYISLWILAALYLLSLCSEIVCSNVPLYVKFNGASYFPVFNFYAEDTFTGNGKQTRPDYHKVNGTPLFRDNPDNYMIFPLVEHGPYQSIDPDTIAVSNEIHIRFRGQPRVGRINIGPDFRIVRSSRFGLLVGKEEENVKGDYLCAYFPCPEELTQAIASRFDNRPSPPITIDTTSPDGGNVTLSLSTYSPRNQHPKTVRITVREAVPEQAVTADYRLVIEAGKPALEHTNGDHLWPMVPPVDQERLLEAAKKRAEGPVDSLTMMIGNTKASIAFIKTDVRFPFPPIPDHPLGIDSSGRDVFARILYGMRWSMSFGLLLVICSMSLGITAGAVQGYYGGLIDITSQRFIEIWSALPFLYIMILMGSIYGRSFGLLLFCYGIFNWIGISYYIRAEFLRLRKQPFVEAAKCMGISSFKIIFKHILPNGLIPVITFFPFSLVGAIGALAALDYLGFGLPPPTPSWGELLFQAQQYRWAWWLILFPSLILFVVMLLGVFVGEGIRNAYDPKRFTRLEG
jgi:microcin C transport system permease protein